MRLTCEFNIHKDIQEMSTTAALKKTGSSLELYYKTHMESLGRENKLLRTRLDKLEHQNKELVRTVLELNLK